MAGLLEMVRAGPGNGGGGDRDPAADDRPPTPPGYPMADMSMTDAVLSHGQVELAMADSGRHSRPGDTPTTGSVP